VLRPTIHLVNPLVDAFGGSERRTLNYFSLLGPHADVTLWAEGEPHAQFAGLPLRRLDPTRNELPRGGMLVLVGIYVERAHWLTRARPERLIVIYNTIELFRLRRLLEYMTGAGLPHPELVCCSETLRASTQLPGFVDWGVYDFNAFAPPHHAPDDGPFTVGRLSRDDEHKHHPQDLRLYRDLAERGMKVRLMGATVLRERLGNVPSIELLPAGAVAAPDFLRSLDAFVYRTGPMRSEPAGRIVVEAMACELPVVVGRNGGYCELIDHGSNGFIFDTHREAIGYVDALRADPALARRVGQAARAAVVERFGEAHLARVREFFLNPEGAAVTRA
jgi:glycosyltransferase involved in cell wall biosynthesis